MNMNPNRRLLALVLSALMLTGTAAAYNGSLLSRGPVADFTLIDQHGDPFSFEADAEGVVVVSFIFTRCPDVCPVLTMLLSAVEDELTEQEREDVTFVSITVDPEHDTPETLLEYSERMGASWPHLTGNLSEMEPIWAMFGVVVQQNVIDVHVMDYQPGEASVTIVNTSNVSAQHMFDWSGWNAVRVLADEAGWDLNVSTIENESTLTGIGGVEAPSDGAWSWNLKVWDVVLQTWVGHLGPVEGLNALEAPHVAWMPSNGNVSTLPVPDEEQASSMSVLWPNGSVAQHGLDVFNAYHITRGALGGADINVSIEDSQYGNYLSGIAGELAPEDREWFWNLHSWNEANATWELSNLDLDEYTEPGHIAWAPSFVNVSTVPSPNVGAPDDANACNGHGWEMGSGDSKHCMCDEGYTWGEDDPLSCVLETSEDYNVGHSTITYILNDELEPTVAWAGDRWRVEEFTADVREMLEKEQLAGNEGGFIPSLSAAMSLSALMLAAAVLPPSRRDSDSK